MYVSRLFIRNYRSISQLDLVLRKGKNILIGRNNAGKSNVIKALDLVLGEASPTYAKASNLSLGDFHTRKEHVDGHDQPQLKSADDLLIWCELTREPNEQIDYDEIYRCFGYYVCTTGYRSNDPFRFERGSLPLNYQAIFEMNDDNSPGKKYVNPKLRNQQPFENEFDDKYSFAFAFRAQKAVDGLISKDIRFLYSESTRHNWILALKASVRNELLQTAIIPSFRDPQNQLRLTNWTWYGKLMQNLIAKHLKSEDLRKALDSVQSVAEEIFVNVRREIVESALSVAFPGTELSFQLNADSGGDFYKNCAIYVDDGFKSPLIDKGSGIQSATIIGLFTYYTKHVSTIAAALLCIEEPELYLHPHARRVISDRLDEFVGDKNQVVITTHSAEFLRSTGIEVNVVVISKTAQGDTISQSIELKDFSRVLVNDSYGELFFADKVLICEGFDDFLIRAVAKGLFPQQLDSRNISVVSVGGKDNISKLARLVLDLGIECYVIADFDYLLRDSLPERSKYQGAKAHESVVNLGPQFFRQSCTFGDRGQAVISKIQKTRDHIKSSNESGFYTAKSAGELNYPNMDVMLKYLRTHGLCILSKEIERFFKGEFIHLGQKLSLERIFALNAHLSSGVQIGDIFDGSELIEFLQAKPGLSPQADVGEPRRVD